MNPFESFGARSVRAQGRVSATSTSIRCRSSIHWSDEMKRSIFVVAAALVALVAFTTPWSARGAPVSETVTVAADEAIPNVPGKRLVSLIVEYPPGASSPEHRHARSAFIYAYAFRARSGARSKESLPASIGPGRHGSRVPVPTIG